MNASVLPSKGSSKGSSTSRSRREPRLWSTSKILPTSKISAKSTDIGILFGVGFGTYFASLELLVVFFGVWSLFTVFPATSNIMTGSESHAGLWDWWVKGTLFSVIIKPDQDECCGGHSTKTMMFFSALLDSMGNFLFLAGLWWARMSLVRLGKKIDINAISLEDYTIWVRDLPLDRSESIKSKAALNHKMRTFFADIVKAEREREKEEAGDTLSRLAQFLLPLFGEQGTDRVQKTLLRVHSLINTTALPLTPRARDEIEEEEEEADPVYQVVFVPDTSVVLRSQRDLHKVQTTIRQLELAGTQVNQKAYAFKWSTLSLWWFLNYEWLWALVVPASTRLAVYNDRAQKFKRQIQLNMKEFRDTKVVSAFVTFKSERDKVRALKVIPDTEQRPDGAKPLTWQSIARLAPLQAKYEFLHNVNVRTEPAPEAGELLWEHLYVDPRPVAPRMKAAAVFLSVVLLFCVVVIMVKWVGQRDMLQIDCHTVQVDYSDIGLGVSVRCEDIWPTPTALSQMDHIQAQVNWQDCNVPYLKYGVWQYDLCELYNTTTSSSSSSQNDLAIPYDGGVYTEPTPDANRDECAAAVCYFCYCSDIKLSSIIHQDSVYEYCDDYLHTYSIATLFDYLGLVITTVVNLALFPLMTTLTLHEQHHTLARFNLSLAVKMFFSLLVVTGLVPILSYMDWKTWPGNFLRIFFGGFIEDFNGQWYLQLGVTYLTNFAINAVVVWPIRQPGLYLVQWLIFKIQQWLKPPICEKCLLPKSECPETCTEDSPKATLVCSSAAPLERLLSGLMRCNWPESADALAPSCSNFKRLLDGTLLYYLLDNPAFTTVLDAATFGDGWRGGEFCSLADAWGLRKTLERYRQRMEDRVKELSADERFYADLEERTHCMWQIDQMDLFEKFLQAVNWPKSATLPSSAVPSSAVPSSAVPASAVPSSAIPSSGASPLSLQGDDGADSSSSSERYKIDEGVMRDTLDRLLEMLTRDDSELRDDPVLMTPPPELDPNKDSHQFYSGLPQRVRVEIKKHHNKQYLDNPPTPGKPEFSLAQRNGQLLSTVYLALLFSSGMPVMIWLATLSLLFQLLSDRWMLLAEVAQRPVRVGDHGTRRVMDLLLLAAALHALVGIWMYGYREIPSWRLFENQSLALETESAASDGCSSTYETSHPSDKYYTYKANALPFFVVLGSSLVLVSVRIYQVVVKALKDPAVENEFNPRLTKVLGLAANSEAPESSNTLSSADVDLIADTNEKVDGGSNDWKLRGPRTYSIVDNNRYKWLVEAMRGEDEDTKAWFKEMFDCECLTECANVNHQA